MVTVTGVEPGSLCDRHGVKAGDVLSTVNGAPIADVLDYRFYLTDKKVVLAFVRDGKDYTVRLKKGEYDDIGLSFETPLMDKKHTCKNGCVFCFIDQNPKGMRDPIYFKDDDSRLSFLHGNYITLTNMTQEDIDRIIKMRMSPINISVHTTDPELRVKMMKNKRAGEVLSYLRRLKDADLSMCGQIVLCRGINDGADLERTLSDLSEYYPQMGSVSVVPAGLTAHREGLCPLTDFTPQEAANVIATVDRYAQKMKEKYGSRMFFAADEFYLKAGMPIPQGDYYEDYAQIENGVGMIRSLTDEFSDAIADGCLADECAQREVSVATGAAAYPTVRDLCRQMECKYPRLKIHVYRIVNHFFGESITVSGLLTGRDLYDQLKGRELGEELLISANALRRQERDFLCGMTLAELSERLGVPIRTVENDGFDLADALLGVKEEV